MLFICHRDRNPFWTVSKRQPHIFSNSSFLVSVLFTPTMMHSAHVSKISSWTVASPLSRKTEFLTTSQPFPSPLLSPHLLWSSPSTLQVFAFNRWFTPTPMKYHHQIHNSFAFSAFESGSSLHSSLVQSSIASIYHSPAFWHFAIQPQEL